MDLIYLDNNATTMVAPAVVEAMVPYLTKYYGNPSSMHRLGQRSRQAIDQARSQAALLIGCSDSELLFTGGGTEAVNTAIRGILSLRTPRKKIITTTVEHSATFALAEQLKAEGMQVVTIDVDQKGVLNMDRFKREVDDQTALVTSMWANNETGVLFPVAEMAEICRAKKVPIHVDGTQAVGKIPTSVKDAGLDAMSFASHKFHGPKGVGALYIRRGLRIRPHVLGGPQENNRRGGTENLPGIVGFGKAAEMAMHKMEEMSRVAFFRDRLERDILSRIEETYVNGRTDMRVPNTTNISFANLHAEAILISLSEHGVCASAGAACSSGSLEPSRVLAAMGIPDRIARGAIRFSLSVYTKSAEVDRAVDILIPIISKLRAVLPVGV
jgi:cysteine desulfurase